VNRDANVVLQIAANCPVGIGQRSQIISGEGQLEEAYANL
jgi:hypothetical protein